MHAHMRAASAGEGSVWSGSGSARLRRVCNVTRRCHRARGRGGRLGQSGVWELFFTMADSRPRVWGWDISAAAPDVEAVNQSLASVAEV